MLGEGASQFLDRKVIEVFGRRETAAATHFEQLLRAFCVEKGIAPDFKKVVNETGSAVFYSRAIAAAIRRHYVKGTLDRNEMSNASDGDLLRFVVGAHLRGGEPGVAVIYEPNGSRKLSAVGHALKHLHCAQVKLFYAEGVPTAFALVFSPSPPVRRTLKIKKVYRFWESTAIGRPDGQVDL